MTKIIEVIVNPKGETTVATKGFAGASCQQASRFLEDALGLRVREERTSEFYQSLTAEQVQQQQQR
jgi:4-hydroxy-3-methylbut-2-en-1-yl diphosphate synthase IspG/GcpE